MPRASTPGEQTCSARFRVRQLRVGVLVFENISHGLSELCCWLAVALLSLMYNRHCTPPVDQQRYFSAQHHQQFIDTSISTTTTTTDRCSSSSTNSASCTAAIAPASDDVSDDVTAVDEGEGQVQGEMEAAAATNEKTALRSRDMDRLQNTSPVLGRPSDDSAVHGRFSA